MTTETLTGRYFKPAVANLSETSLKLVIFHCINALDDACSFENENYEIKSIKLPCSSLTREVVLLRAFESGADAVLVLVCPEGACHYLQGNIRATKRVARVKKILDEIGIDGRRLNIYPVSHGDTDSVIRLIDKTVGDLAFLGPNPAV